MQRGFRIVEMQMDGQFEPLQGALRRNENNHERMLRSRAHRRYRASGPHGKVTRPRSGHAPTLQEITCSDGD